jgi:hypothetical protein
MADRGVSETIGFVLIFALIVTTLGIVYTTGMAGLTDARDVERVNNAERAFDVLADNIETITQRNAPSRATELKLADASLRTAEGDRITVEMSGQDERVESSGAIRYDSNTGTDILYTNGAVIRDSPSGNVLVHGPHMAVSEERTIIHLTDLSGVGSPSVSGDRTVLLRVDDRNTIITTATDGDHQVTVDVETERPDAWEAHFDSLDSAELDCDSSDSSVTCTFESDRVYVTKSSLDVAFS